MVNRLFNYSKTNSFFLFGARGTGKTTLLRTLFPEPNLYLDFLDDETWNRFSKEPKLLESFCDGRHPWIILDEVQRIPKILNHVHRMIENQKQKFAMSGSSSRKLKYGGANLLAGRAFLKSLFPLSYLEIPDHFDLSERLRFGNLPKLFALDDEQDKMDYLKSYWMSYIREEIQMEQIVRKLEPFRDFLPIAAQSSGCILNFSKIAKQVGVFTTTVQSYFQILEDTNMGFMLRSYHPSIRKSQLVSPKFYFFDVGVMRALRGEVRNHVIEETHEYGNLFEMFIVLDIHKLNDLLGLDYHLSYFATKNESEVDLVLSRGKTNILLEIKSTKNVDEVEIRKLAKIRESFPKNSKAFMISRDSIPRTQDGVECMEWTKFLREFQNDFNHKPI